jgi:hypothetical protein
MVLGGTQLYVSNMGTTHPAPLASPGAGRASGVDPLAGAIQSLTSGAGPARGLTGSCSPLGSSTSCQFAPAAQPRPQISANGTWINLTGSLVGGKSSQPAARWIANMVWDAYDGYILLFGGYSTSGLFSDTWTYQNGTWTELNEVQSPGGRYGGQMAYDPAEHAVILFSGYSSSTGTCYNDTWSFSNGTWTQLASYGPIPRWRADFDYDADAGYLVLTAGSNAGESVFYADTWKFQNDTWTNLTSVVKGGEPDLVRGAMVWDAHDHELVLFGGSTPQGTSVSQTWTFANLTWTKLNTTPAPSARVYIFLSYDPGRSAVILYGGSPASESGTPDSDTWQFQGGYWTELTPLVHPPPLGYGTMAYYPVGGYVLLFSGYNNAVYVDQTWAFGADGAMWGNATPAALDAGLTSHIKINAVSPLKNLSYQYSNLPAGCASDNVTLLNCTPTGYGNFDVIATAYDNGGDNISTNISLDVREDPTVNGITFSPSIVDIGNTTTITGNVSGGTVPFVFNWTALPPGCLSVDAPTLACSPNQTGTFPVTLTFKDAAGFRGSDTVNLTVNSTPTIERYFATPAAIDLGQSAILNANVIEGTPPYSFVWTNLPIGCVTNNTPALTCSPVAPGTYIIEAQATDAFNNTIAGNLSLVVNRDPQFASGGATPSYVDAGAKLNLYSNASYGTAPYSYAFTGLPTGCTATNARVATCTPTTAGNFTVVEHITDAAGLTVISGPIKVNVVPDPNILGFTSDPYATDVGHGVTLTVTAANGSGLYTYDYTGLPGGCNTENTASLSCTPSVVGQPLVTVTVTDSQGKSASANLTLTVAKIPTVTLTVSPNSVAPGTSVLFVALTSNGVGLFSYRFTGLPVGCSSSNHSEIRCSPTATGVYNVQVVAYDQAGVSATGSTQLTVQTTTSSTFLGLPLLTGVGIVLIVILVVIIAIVMLLLRRRKPPAKQAPPAKP